MRIHTCLWPRVVSICRSIVGIAVCVSILGCASQAPPARADRKAEELGFSKETLDTGVFRHIVFRNAPPIVTQVLHIYIEGDGLPFVHRGVIAKDPTPDTPVMLELMGKDNNPSVYVGRPCYFGLYADPNCNAYFWTSGRYADVVVTSMVSAIRRISEEYGSPSTVRLFGHSGGGSLALLVAGRVEEVATVVTIGANLDIEAWADYHGYTRLEGSLNPAERQTTRDLQVIHLVGAEDQTTPPALVLGAGGALSHDVRVIPGIGHTCCWTQTWVSILSELADLSSGITSGTGLRN